MNVHYCCNGDARVLLKLLKNVVHSAMAKWVYTRTSVLAASGEMFGSVETIQKALLTAQWKTGLCLHSYIGQNDFTHL